MSEVKVTREHRNAAVQAVVCDNISEYTLQWAEVGGDVSQSAYAGPIVRVARAIAATECEAEHRVRAAVIADLRGLLERAAASGYVEYDSLELFIETLESQQ